MKFPAQWNAVVTGAGGGLGRALALDVARRGANILVADIDMAGAEETVSLLKAQGVQAIAMACDVADRDAVFAVVDACEREFGSVDLIANNAGVAVSGGIEEVSVEDWRWIVDINLWGVIHGCQAAIPKMRAAGRGYVLNVASAAGLLSPPQMAPYNVTKAAVVALSETLYADHKHDGIHVAVLCPTFFKTNILEAGRGKADPKLEGFAAKAMIRSKIQAPDVAKMAIDAVRDNRLYVQPMADGRTAWRMKRLSPQRFYDSVSAAHNRFGKPRKP